MSDYPVICPECRGDCNYPAPSCHTCDGSGEVMESAPVCDYCEEPSERLMLVRDWNGYEDNICPACWDESRVDPVGYGQIEVVA